MKIAVIDPWFFTPPYDRELCDALASIGHDVTLIGRCREDDEGSVGRSALTFTILGLFKAPKSWLPRSMTLLAKGLRHVQGLAKCVFTLRRLRPDVIHIQWLSLPIVDSLFIPIFRRIAPVVLTVHDSNPYNGAGPLLLRFGNGLASRRFDRWIVHNELSEARLLQRGFPADRVHRIAHGLLEQKPNETSSVRVRDDGRVHLLQFGKIKDYKGVDVLLNALGLLDEELRDRFHVSIVGRPYLDTEPIHDLMARHRLNGFVDLKLDFVSDTEMTALFDDADVLVFPYRDIDTSGVLMAAIARGIPVVASDIGCFSEMLHNGKDCRLVPPDNHKALADALVDLLKVPDTVSTLRQGMLELRERIPTWQRIAESTTDVYKSAQAPLVTKAIGAPI